MFGTVSIWIALLGALGSLGGYLGALRGRESAWRIARYGYGLLTAAVLVGAGRLLALFWGHHFEVDYVYRYSSRDLPLFYLLSAFWAGQEGSLLLWVLLGALMGLFLLVRAREYEAEVMTFFTLVQGGLLVLLLLRSPFARLDTSSFPAELLAAPGVPRDGAGLNPLLQNPWMVVHPPLLFLGYAALLLPYVFALAGLWRREYEKWAKLALPWTIFAWVALGAGIIVGGYWAYETLGWGGYWGWDPVENASLIPWLLCTALLHGILLQRARGGLGRINLVLAMSTFAFVLYASYLTRSGVLGEVSVHSFEEPNGEFNVSLLGFILIALLPGGYLLALRWRDLPFSPAFTDFRSREFTLYLLVILLLISAALVWVGTSLPLITVLFARQTVSVEPSFYNRTQAPLGFLLLLLLGLCPLLASRGWRRGASHLWRSPAYLTGLGLLVAAGLIVRFNFHHALSCAPIPPQLSVTFVAKTLLYSLPWLLFIGAALFALTLNLTLVWRTLKRASLPQASAHFTHMGLALMLLGIVVSSVYESKARLSLPQGETRSVFGYRLTYEGLHPRPDGKTEVRLAVEQERTVYKARPLLTQTSRGEVRTPAIKRNLGQDLYLEPEEILPAQQARVVRLRKGESKNLGEYTVEFVRFELRPHQEDASNLRVGAVLKIRQGSRKEELIPWLRYVHQQPESTPAVLKDGQVAISLERINADEGTVTLRFTGISLPPEEVRKETAVIFVTVKPFMNALWLGCGLLLSGGLLAIHRLLHEGQGT